MFILLNNCAFEVSVSHFVLAIFEHFPVCSSDCLKDFPQGHIMSRYRVTGSDCHLAGKPVAALEHPAGGTDITKP